MPRPPPRCPSMSLYASAFTYAGRQGVEFFLLTESINLPPSLSGPDDDDDGDDTAAEAPTHKHTHTCTHTEADKEFVYKINEISLMAFHNFLCQQTKCGYKTAPGCVLVCICVCVCASVFCLQLFVRQHNKLIIYLHLSSILIKCCAKIPCKQVACKQSLPNLIYSRCTASVSRAYSAHD